MAIKKYTNGSWASASYRKYGTETDAITAPPTTVIGDGTPISSYTIKGNTERLGTPTPENPIMPSWCGVMTENLFDKSVYDSAGVSTYNCVAASSSTGLRLTATGNDPFVGQVVPSGTSASRYSRTFIPCDPNTTYTISANKMPKCYITYVNSENVSVDTANIPQNASKFTFTTPANTTYLLFRFGDGEAKNGDIVEIRNITFVEGSTAPTSYIPYGYKLPITLGSTTTNMYLGEVQSTRRIKKLVLTGEENWTIESTDNFYTASAIVEAMDTTTVVCSHQVSLYNYYMAGVENVWVSATGRLNFTTNTVSHTASDFKSYLAAQYAAGTPVTVWYVLAEPTTGIVNEPLMKIGDYADSVSGTNLATSGAAQELDVATTLKPSELDLTYHGWHEHEDTRFTT